MKLETRTQRQMNAYFLFHEFVAEEMRSQGVTLDKLVTEIQPQPTKNALHEVFKAILLSMYGKDSTKGMTREEMNACLDVYMDALSKIGVEIEFPDASKKHLLQFYN
jgi:hypothetical protein